MFFVKVTGRKCAAHEVQELGVEFFLEINGKLKHSNTVNVIAPRAIR